VVAVSFQYLHVHMLHQTQLTIQSHVQSNKILPCCPIQHID